MSRTRLAERLHGDTTRQDMGYYIRRDHGEQGPFTRSELRELLREGEISRDIPARRETREEWRTAGDFLRKRSRKKVVVPEEDEEETLDDASGADEQDQGSFILGFIAGLIGGCVVLALVLRRGKPRHGRVAPCHRELERNVAPATGDPTYRLVV
jgi:hypothetical protein